MQITPPLLDAGRLVHSGTLSSVEFSQATTLQRLRLNSSTVRRALYWRAFPLAPGQARADAKVTEAGIELGSATQLSFDTYFNSFFEAPWHRITGLRSVSVQVDVEGAGLLRIYRRALDRHTLVLEEPVESGTSRFCIPIERVNFRQQGVLSLELWTGETSLTLRSGAWLSDQPAATDPGLAAASAPSTGKTT